MFNNEAGLASLSLVNTQVKLCILSDNIYIVHKRAVTVIIIINSTMYVHVQLQNTLPAVKMHMF